VAEQIISDLKNPHLTHLQVATRAGALVESGMKADPDSARASNFIDALKPLVHPSDRPELEGRIKRLMAGL
jgi:hypothetical protein